MRKRTVWRIYDGWGLVERPPPTAFKNQRRECHLQKQGNVTDEKLHPEEKEEGGRRHFFPAVGGHLGELGVVVQEEELVV